MYYVYILKSCTNQHMYIGYTENLRARLSDHNNRKVVSTKANVPYNLVYYEAYRSKSDALKRENRLKRYNQTYTRLKGRISDSLAEQN
ncbi:MAG: GIY-YIG nuclease family protein [Patescibacteria group bacterium]